VLFLLCSTFATSAVLWDIAEVLLDASRYFFQAKSFAVYGPHFFLARMGVRRLPPGQICRWYRGRLKKVLAALLLLSLPWSFCTLYTSPFFGRPV
jgi:hypothetical protein